MPINFWYRYRMIWKVLSFSHQSQFFAKRTFLLLSWFATTFIYKTVHFNHVLSNFSVNSVFTETVFFPWLHCQFTDINISGQFSIKTCKFFPISEEGICELQIRLFCVEDMSLESSILFAAFVSKVPFFRGLSLGVLSQKAISKRHLLNIINSLRKMP